MAHPLELNYCPRCGHPLEDREAFGRVRRCCPACGQVMFRDHKVAAGVLVVQEARVLLVRRRWMAGSNRWSIPAGFVEYDETPVAAAVRECREETGLEVESTGLLDVIAGREHEGGADLLIVYSACVVGGVLTPGDDADQAAFFPRGDLPPLAFRATAQALAHWLGA